MGNNDKDGIIQLPVPPVPVPPDRPFVMPPKTVDVGHDCRAFEPCADCADENAVVNAPPCVGCYHGGVYDINRDGFPCLWRTVEPGRAQDETPEPPTLSSMRGIAPGMTGGMDSVEFVRRGRDGATIICDAVTTPGDLDSLAARVRELEAALEWLRDKQLLRIVRGQVWQATMARTRDFVGQSAEDFYSCLSAAVGAQVGPREGEQGC